MLFTQELLGLLEYAKCSAFRKLLTHETNVNAKGVIEKTRYDRGIPKGVLPLTGN